MDRVTLRVPRDTLADVDALVESGVYPSRSEAIRDALRGLDGVDEHARTTGNTTEPVTNYQ